MRETIRWILIPLGMLFFLALDLRAESARFESVVKLPDVEVFLWKDISNVYVLRDLEVG